MRNISTIAITIFLVLVLAVPTFAGGKGHKETEPQPQDGIWGKYPDVIAEYIKIPGYQEPHTPHEFNNIYFMRYRYDTGKSRPSPVKAIILGQPGHGSGQAVWFELASQVVDTGQGDIEFWVIDRRENCFEDTEGLRRAIKAQDGDVAYEYYYGSDPKSNPQYDGDEECVVLTQNDLSFMAYWGNEVAFMDVEAILNLIPKGRQATNVFLAGHSQGGSFISQFAAYEFPDGKAGYEKVAGLLYLDGGPWIGEDNEATLDEWEQDVQELIDGDTAVWGVEVMPGQWAGPVEAAITHIYAMEGTFDPDGESEYGIRVGPTGGMSAYIFLSQLRVTNEAVIGWRYDDDPIPGSGTGASYMLTGGLRNGRLDFPSIEGSPGPFPLDEALRPAYYMGLSTLIDPDTVYGWLSGGGGEVAGETDDGPLNGYGDPSYGTPDWDLDPPNPNVTRSDSVALMGFFGGQATNIKGPTRYDFAETGEVEIYEGSANNALWYMNVRYDVDNRRAADLWAPEMNIIRNTDIDVPVMVYSGGESASRLAEWVEATSVTDWTLIDTDMDDGDGPEYSPEAAALTTFPVETNARIYNHMDFMMADNSLSGTPGLFPGDVGVNVITNTVIDWMMARVRGKAPVPSPKKLGVDQSPHRKRAKR